MVFLILFSMVLLILYSYVGWRLILPLDISTIYRYLLGILLVLFYCLPLLTIIFYFNKVETQWTRIIAWLGYTGLGTVSLLFFIQLGVDIISGLSSLIGKNHKFDPYRRAFLGLSAKGVVGALGVIGTIWGLYNAVKTPIIKKVEISIEGLPESLQGFRMAQITDLHVGSMITG